MASVTRTVEVKVVAEYWATTELEEGELNKTEEELSEMAWREFYDEANRASIEEVIIENDVMTCWDCKEDGVDESHECEECNICGDVFSPNDLEKDENSGMQFCADCKESEEESEEE